MKVKLTPEEISLLLKKWWLTIDNWLTDSFLEIDDSEADRIRDLCWEDQQVTWFDSNYNLTSEWKIMDSIIDKFYS